MSLGLVADNLESISNSQFKSVIKVDNHAAGWASTNRRLAEISTCAALATMNEEFSTATHLARFLGVKIEGAWFCDRGIVHSVLAVLKFIPGCWKRSRVNHALLFGVHVSSPLAWVSISVYVPFTWSTNKVTSVLVVSVCLSWSAGKSLTALSKASTFMGMWHFQELRCTKYRTD